MRYVLHTQLECNFLFTYRSPDRVPSVRSYKIALLGDGVPQEAMSSTCICMDTQNGKLLNTSQTQVFDIFGRVINDDT